MASTKTIDDSLAARISPDCPDETRQILYHAAARDRSGLKGLVSGREQASAQDPKTGETPLHAAIRSCGPATPGTPNGTDAPVEDGSVEEAKEVVQELFFSGAIWNDVDANNETPGCVALRLGRKALYEMCVDAGVRAEMLFALMEGYEQLSSGPADEIEEEEVLEEKPDTALEDGDEAPELVEAQAQFQAPEIDDKPVTSEQYLQSELQYDGDKLVDEDLNGVMMAWETDIMRRSVRALIPDSAPGKRILNIGLGMGIIDDMFAELKPSKHHIIEAHPAVLNHMVYSPSARFGSEWEARGPEPGAFKVHTGRWQDVVNILLEEGEVYDAIYFDTFGEDYAQLREFFTEHIISLLDQEGRFSFFNGLGADRRICYDVYQKVVDMHCSDAGLDVEWEETDVDMSNLGEEGKGEWEGVRRRYWTLDKYRLPICTFMG